MTDRTPRSGAPGVTPYMNEQGDWWIAVGDVPSRAVARAVVRQHAYEDRIRFEGIETVDLREGEWSDESAPTRHVPAYHFREVES